MPFKQIPEIDEALWKLINPFLCQLHDPGDGGFQIYKQEQRPNNLHLEDIGKIIWNSTKGCFQRWTGSNWEDLSPQKVLIENIVKEIIEEWNPLTPPQWLIDTINKTIDGLKISDLQTILDTWTPSANAKIRSVATNIAKDVLKKGIDPIPEWLTKAMKKYSSTPLPDNIPLKNIQTALNSYWRDTIGPAFTLQETTILSAVDDKLELITTALSDLSDNFDTLSQSFTNHQHGTNPNPTTITPTPTPTPTSSSGIYNVSIKLTQRPGTMRVNYVPPYSQGSLTGVKVIEAAFDITINYSGSGIASSLVGTYFAPPNGYKTPSGERKVLAYGINNIGTLESPYTLQNYYLPITSTSTVSPRKTWKYYVIKGSNGINYFQYDSSKNWNTFLSDYYLDHIEIPYGGFNTTAWKEFWNTLDPSNRSLFPQS